MRSFILLCLFVTCFTTLSFSQGEGAEVVGPSRRKHSVTEIGGGTACFTEDRAAAYAKLLEGQRFIWTARNTNSTLARNTASRLAKDALQKAVELNPRLAEGYTALAEIALRGAETDIEEAIKLSETAVKLDRDNFGGHKFLGRLYTVKSGLDRDRLDSVFSRKAIDSWKEVARLDPQNAEAWAFLSTFYKELGDSKARIVALRNWLASANTNDAGFYLTVVRGSEGLAPELAALKLGEALLDNDQKAEALVVLSNAVSDNPENLRAIDLLGRALENSEDGSLKPAVEALRQAVYSNPENISLIQMLAETLAKIGDTKGAAKVISDGTAVVPERQSSGLYMALGDIYSDVDRIDEAIAAYKKALSSRGIKGKEIVDDSDRGFTLLLINKMVQTLQKSGRIRDAESVIDDSRGLFSVDNFAMDREKVSLMSDTGRRMEALNLLRKLRQTAPDDYNLIRKEADLLTDLGRVDEAVTLILPLIEKKPVTEVRSIKYDDFVNRLFISGLFVRAGKGTEALYHAEKALEVATSDQSRQLATLRIAAAQFVAGDLSGAETKLKTILKATPNNPMALNDLGYLYLKKGSNFQEALTLIEKAVNIDPRNPEYLDSLGLAHYKLGNLEQAERYLRKALRYDISSPTAYERLGDVLQKKGNETEAHVLWKKALTFVTNTADAKRIEDKMDK